MRFIIVPEIKSRDWNHNSVHLSDFSSTQNWYKCVLLFIYLENFGLSLDPSVV